jgi:hypothetical protein
MKGTVDTLQLSVGNSQPDILIVTIGEVKGWRGDECGYVADPGVIKVILNGVEIYSNSNEEDSPFIIKR